MGVEPSPELLHYCEMAKGNESLNRYVQQFPFEEYEIFNVNNLGRFFVDDIPDSIKSHLRLGIYWESGIGELVKRFTKPDTIAIDLGAHIGIHTITMSRYVGPNGLVVSFEPQWKIFREQFYNLRLNDTFHNVILLPFAVGDVEQAAEMSVRQPTNEGHTSIGEGGDPTYMITLDSLNLNDVSFIKMDVESYELNILKGAVETILRNKPVIVFEILGGYNLDTATGEIKATYEETLQFLTGLGYSVKRIFNTNDFIAYPCQSDPSDPFSHPEVIILSNHKQAGIQDVKQRAFKYMKSLEGWCTRSKASILMDLVLTLEPKTIVEVGVFGGKSLIPMACALKAAGRGKIYGIDPWDSAESVKGMDSVNCEWWGSLDHRKILLDLQLKIMEFGLQRQIELIEATSELAPPIPCIDILHLDGNHSEKASYADVRKWVPLVRKGGVIIFNDLTWGTNINAVKWMDEHCIKLARFEEGNEWGIWIKP